MCTSPTPPSGAVTSRRTLGEPTALMRSTLCFIGSVTTADDFKTDEDYDDDADFLN